MNFEIFHKLPHCCTNLTAFKLVEDAKGKRKKFTEADEGIKIDSGDLSFPIFSLCERVKKCGIKIKHSEILTQNDKESSHNEKLLQFTLTREIYREFSRQKSLAIHPF